MITAITLYISVNNTNSKQVILYDIMTLQHVYTKASTPMLTA